MSVTLTIKQVPEALAARLKMRAAGQRRSLQKELLSIMEEAVEWEDSPAASSRLHAAEPVTVTYAAHSSRKHGRSARGVAPGRLTLDQLWQRARRLGAGMASESAAIVRRDRDASHCR